MADTLFPLDALVVLGARLNPQGEPGRVARWRLRHALEIWRDRAPEAHILLVGGCPRGAPHSEAEAMARWAEGWVMQHWGAEVWEDLAPRLILEEASLNTAASARNVLSLVQGLNFRKVGLVSDGLHIHRAHYLFRRHFLPHRIAVHPLPVHGLVKHYWQSRRYLWLTKMTIREAGAWVKVLGRRALEWRRR